MIYCDGSFHQGNNKVPVKYKETQLYFRGAVNTRSHLKYLNSKYPFESAKKVVLTGSSAGGMATYIWTDYVKDLVGDKAEYYAIPDSSIFLDTNMPISPIMADQEMLTSDNGVFLYNLANKDESAPNTKCAEA